MQRIGSLAFKFWMWWPPKDWYPRSDCRISQILVKSIKEIWREIQIIAHSGPSTSPRGYVALPGYLNVN